MQGVCSQWLKVAGHLVEAAERRQHVGDVDMGDRRPR
jgi:hypothetical protein